MKESTIVLPVFPLPIFILPGGVTKLRIFEQRYLKMVKISAANQGFVIFMNNNQVKGANTMDSELVTKTQWGSWVKIINFDQGDDGVLEIEVECTSLVQIKSIEKDEDNLHFGTVSEIEHWSKEATNNEGTDNENIDLSTSLKNVFAENDILNTLYPKKTLNDVHWVLARWLEILPIELNIKSEFVVKHNIEEAKGFVESIIFKQ